MNKIIITLAIIGCFFSSQVLAKIDIHFSKVQFYLDDQKRADSLKVNNQGNDDASCSIKLAHYLVSDDGNIKRAKNDKEGVYNSAQQLLRYSPRNIKIPGQSSQVIRLSFRRVPNLDDGEYMSYLRISCTGIRPVGLPGQITNSAVLSYNLPVIIRHGNVNSESEITSAKIERENGNDYVLVEHQRLPEATGSVIGDYEVIGKDSGKVYGKLSSAKVYAPAKYRIQKFNLSENPREPVQIKFSMNPALGEQVVVLDIEN